VPGEEKQVKFPSELLECEEVSREIVFYSEEEIKDFQLLQKVFVHGQEIEQLYFRFGFVIPKSQNSWE
jgi:retinal rod rhodopsin-sensitive cGMP 3',5'-cyclic phosphodiesterase subunit delta